MQTTSHTFNCFYPERAPKFIETLQSAEIEFTTQVPLTEGLSYTQFTIQIPEHDEPKLHVVLEAIKNCNSIKPVNNLITFNNDDKICYYGNYEISDYKTKKLSKTITVSDLLAIWNNGDFNNTEMDKLNEDEAALVYVIVRVMKVEKGNVQIPKVCYMDEWMVGVGKTLTEAKKNWKTENN